MKFRDGLLMNAYEDGIQVQTVRPSESAQIPVSASEALSIITLLEKVTIHLQSFAIPIWLYGDGRKRDVEHWRKCQNYSWKPLEDTDDNRARECGSGWEI